MSTSELEQLSTEDVVYAGIICHGDSVPGQQPCGRVDITESQYDAQMNRPDSLWCCPNCGSTADFDDDRFEELHEPDEPSDPDGECYRGGEYESALAESQARIQRDLK